MYILYALHATTVYKNWIISCLDNVDKKIQEDNLQHLALFAEYGRMALNKPRSLQLTKQHLLDDQQVPPPPQV